MLNKFERLIPDSLEEAVKLRNELYDRSLIYAGGTDILVNILQGRFAPEYLIDIKHLKKLKGVEFSPKTGLKIGALTTLRELEQSPIINASYPVLLDAVKRMASTQVRYRATIGGNICSALPSADSVPPLLVLGANVLIQGPQGERLEPLKNFFIAPRKTVLAGGDIVTHIIVPPFNSQAGSAYIKFTRRKAMDIALLGVAVHLECKTETDICTKARIALATAAPKPTRAAQAENYLVNRELNIEALREAGLIASREAKPRDSYRSTADYRKELIKVLVPRAGLRAIERMNEIEEVL